MSKILYLCLIIFLVSCGKNHIDVPTEPNPDLAPVEVLSTYVSVDYSKFDLRYNLDDIEYIQIQREMGEYPLSFHDGDLVKLDRLGLTSFKDSGIKTLNKNPGKDYYYSIFYHRSSISDFPIWVQNFHLKTLTYQEGMLQLFSELIDYAKSKKTSFEFILGTKQLRLFYQFHRTDNATTLVKNNGQLMPMDSGVLQKISGVLVSELYYKNNELRLNGEGSLNQQNLDVISALKGFNRIFVSDTCNTTGCAFDLRKKINNLNVSNTNGLNIILDNREQNALFEVNENNITSIQDDDLSNFIFLESPVSDMLANLQSKNYDLIIIYPFLDSDKWDLTNMTDISSIKTKSNGNARLVYAYIDVQRVMSDSFYWETDSKDWAHPDVRPDWISAPFDGHFYVKYWREEWKAHLKSVVDEIVSKGYDGIVFGGGEVFSDFECSNLESFDTGDHIPNKCLD